jgi:hypothetical protein
LARGGVGELISFSKLKKNTKNKYEDGDMLDNILKKKATNLI